MGPIFNKKVVKKCNLWDCEQYIYVLFTVDKVNNCRLEEKKKRRKRGKERRHGFQLKPNSHWNAFSQKDDTIECQQYLAL